MLSPSTFERIRVDDYTVAPFTAHKYFKINKNDALERGYTLKRCLYDKRDLPVGYSSSYVINSPKSPDGSYDVLNWRSLDHLYYSNPSSVIESLEGFNVNVTSKFLFLTASIISAPFMDFGEGFKPRSISISSSNLQLKDDGLNNLYDSQIESSSFVDTNQLNAYWGFQELYRFTPKGRGSIQFKTQNYFSNTHGEGLESEYHNISVSDGLLISGSRTGAQIDFKDTASYVFSKHVKELNYELEDDFTLSFWVKPPLSQADLSSESNVIINKRTYADFTKLGATLKTSDEGNIVTRTAYDTSVQYNPIDIFPYHFEIFNENSIHEGKLQFLRSDGSSLCRLTSSVSINDSSYHHICVVKESNILSLYVDGEMQCSGSDVTSQPTNNYHLIFGAWDFYGKQQFSGSLDEVRFYNTAASTLQVSSSLAESSRGLAYQTSIVGNVFYRRGEIAITSPLPKYYHNLENYNWDLEYKNNYTIFEFETLVRIKAGTYNKTMNPSSLKSFKTNLYLDEFTSGSLRPYATTIGLYNEKLQLVAVGKLARPLKMRDDVDMNVIVRWDY